VQTFAELAAFNPYRNGVVSILEQPQYRSVVEQYESSLRSSRPETVPDRPATETTTRESDILDLLPLGAKSVSTPRRLTHFMSHFSQKAKDISPDQQNLNVVFACAEDEGARAGMFLKDEDGKVKRIPVNPVAFAYCLTMSNKEKKPVKFEEFVPFLQQVVSYNISILKEVVDEADRDKVQQTPQIIANMKDAWIRPPQTNER
ncbi:MAG: hypothetical protein PHQ75_12320, partial [Thermoguttaceae bacterium]|nr:hypothetical protein [Thermoguttaceae bacterium]